MGIEYFHSYLPFGLLLNVGNKNSMSRNVTYVENFNMNLI